MPYTGTRKSNEQLAADVDAVFKQNTTGDVKVAQVGQLLADLVKTGRNAYVVAAKQVETVTFSSGVDQPIANWETPLVITEEFSFAPLTGLATLNVAMVLNFQLQIEFQVGTNRVMTVSSNFSGSGTPGVYKQRGEGVGGNDPTFVPLRGKFDGVVSDTMGFNYQIDGNGDADITGGIMILELAPLINTPT